MMTLDSLGISKEESGNSVRPRHGWHARGGVLRLLSWGYQPGVSQVVPDRSGAAWVAGLPCSGIGIQRQSSIKRSQPHAVLRTIHQRAAFAGPGFGGRALIAVSAGQFIGRAGRGGAAPPALAR
ncbi:hypothetical protein ACQCRO_26805, partial [Ralstonia pseudosolanacearum]